MASKRKEELDEAYEKGKALIREDKQKAKRIALSEGEKKYNEDATKKAAVLDKMDSVGDIFGNGDDTLDAKMSWNKISKPIKSASKSKTTK